MKLILDHPWLITLAASELFLVIVRSKDITILFKKSTQRTNEERLNVERGLLRSIILELLIFAPASSALVLLLLPLIHSRFDSLFNSPSTAIAAYALVGLVSYGFPFAAVRRIATTVALNTLKEFATLKNYEGTAIGPSTSATLDESRKDGPLEP